MSSIAARFDGFAGFLGPWAVDLGDVGTMKNILYVEPGKWI